MRTSDIVLYAVADFRAFSVVETVDRTYKIACDTSYTVECNVIGILLTSAARA